MDKEIEILRSRINVSWDITPQMSHVINDLVSISQNQIDSIDCVDYSSFETLHMRPGEILSSFIRGPAVSDWGVGKNNRALGALSIPMRKAGLALCRLEMPEEMKGEFVFDEKSKAIQWSSCLSPMGAHTSTHMDFHGSSQVIVHITGEKLWLLWPPTRKNLHWFNDIRDKLSTGDTTLDSIRNLEGLQVLLTSDVPFAFQIPPYCLHAVLTLTPSAHTGCRVWGYPTFEVAMEALQVDLEWIGNPGAYGYSSEKSFGTLQAVLEDLKGWKRLVKETRSTQEPEVSKRIKLVEDKVNNLIKLHGKHT